MGQKTNPTGFRLAVRRNWQSRWYATKKDFPTLLAEDQLIREKLMEKLKQASVPRIFIERASNRVRVKIYTARPGIVIGRKGQEIEKIKEELAKLQNAPVSAEELRKAKNQILANLYRQQKTIEGRANLLGSYEVFYRAMAAAVRGDGPVPVAPEQARDVVRVIECAMASSREGRVVPVPAGAGRPGAAGAILPP